MRKITDKLCSKLAEVKVKTPNSCYVSYKNELYDLLKKMDSSILMFEQKEYESIDDRCEDCVHWWSYYFDEMDTDCGCDIGENTNLVCCPGFKKKNKDKQ